MRAIRAMPETPVSEETIDNVNVLSQDLLPTPERVKAALPLTPKASATVTHGRATIRRILSDNQLAHPDRIRKGQILHIRPGAR